MRNIDPDSPEEQAAHKENERYIGGLKLQHAAHQAAPSAEAIALAVKLSGHTHCFAALRHVPIGGQDWRVCNGCLGDAATIDRELQLPARNAALLLAQSAVDTYESASWYADKTSMELLRDALAAIKAQV